MTTNTRLNFNDPAPDLALPDTTGAVVALASLWDQQPLLLAFLRHFGCTECLSLMAQLVEGQARLAAAGLAVAVVTQGTAEATAEFARERAPGLRLLADPERKAYEAYGLERGSLYQVLLSPKVWQGVARSRQRGIKPQMPPPGQDVRQLSGTFVIGPDGRVRLPFYYDHIADHPPLELLLAGVLGTGWEQPFEGPLGK
jgi:peroxiredoxin